MEETQPQPEEQLTKKERLEAKRQQKMQELERELRKDTYKKIAIAVVLLLIVGAVVAFMIMGKSEPAEVVDKSPDPSKGPDTAAVVIKEYSDFQCPGCAGAYPVVKDLLEEYGDKVKFIYNDFPLPGHQFSDEAAVAGQCAFDQGKFFEMHDTLFDNQKKWAGSTSADEAQQLFTQYAQDLALDMNAFASCVTSDSASDRVNEDVAEGRALRVNQTPTFFVNGKRVTDLPVSTSLRKAIEEALNGTVPVNQ